MLAALKGMASPTERSGTALLQLQKGKAGSGPSVTLPVQGLVGFSPLLSHSLGSSHLKGGVGQNAFKGLLSWVFTVMVPRDSR